MAGSATTGKHRERNAIELERGDVDHVSEQRLLEHAQNGVDIAWLGALIKHPRLQELQRKSIQKSIDYLTANSLRGLHPVIRERLRKLEHVLRLLDAGKTPDPTKRKKSRGVIRKRVPLPDWMNDPSLLPKRPPGG